MMRCAMTAAEDSLRQTARCEDICLYLGRDYLTRKTACEE